jgi:hypothetical protein
MGTLNKDHLFLIISHSILLIMRNVSDKSCRGNQNTHFCIQQLSSENRAVFEMWKNTVEWGRPQIAIRRMRIVYWLYKDIHTLRIRNTYAFPLQQCKNAHQCYRLSINCTSCYRLSLKNSVQRDLLLCGVLGSEIYTSPSAAKRYGYRRRGIIIFI